MTLHRKILSLFAVGLTLALVSPSALAAVPAGPAGDSFYSPAAAKLKTGKHGDAIWTRAGQSALQLDNAAQVFNIVYKSKSLTGKTVPVSGTVWVPKGTAPAGGWPVISWGHGTVGSADICAPSKIQSVDSGGYTSYVFPVFEQWLAAGYAIEMTDYEGLGTPGAHPYLMGNSEGRGMIDIVLAAHQAVPAISTKWLAAGHSQGGHAALFAGSNRVSYGQGTTLKGVAAFAPASNLKTAVITATGVYKEPNSISGLGALIIRTITFADPSLKLSDIMNPAALALVPQIEQRCLGDTVGVGLGATDSFGKFAPGNLLKSWNGKGWTNVKVKKALSDLNKPDINSAVHIPGVSVRLFQGSADGTVPSFTTKALLGQLKAKNGSSSTSYKEYDGVTHGGIVSAAKDDALVWINSRFAN